MGKANISNKHKQLAATTIMQSLTFISVLYVTALQFTITCIVSESVKTLHFFLILYNWKWNTQPLNQSKTSQSFLLFFNINITGSGTLNH